MMNLQSWVVRTVAAAVVCAPLVASAQSTLAVADASKFIGNWAINMDTPQGAFTMNLNLTDKSGKVGGEISADVLPTQEITDITKSGEDLVLKYASDFQGQAVQREDHDERRRPQGQGDVRRRRRPVRDGRRGDQEIVRSPAAP